MFEKFTERARKVMSYSRQEAQRLNSEFIGTEHILLGILNEEGGVAFKVLKRLLGEKYKTIRGEIEKLLTVPTIPPTILGQLPFSPRAKRVMELAGEAGSTLGADYLGTEHLLLGLIKENEGIAALVLTNFGLKLEEVRDEILEELGGPDAIVEEVPSHKLDSDTAITATFNLVSGSEPGAPKAQVERIEYLVRIEDGDARVVESAVKALEAIKGVTKVHKVDGAVIEHKLIDAIVNSLLEAKMRRVKEDK